MTVSNQQALDGVAIIGMAGRFPGAKNIKEFWANLRDGVEAISFFTEQELASVGIPGALLSDPNYVKARGFLENTDHFDASFFGFNPREAEVMDPQHRLFLECAWEALETAGYNPETYHGLIGLYAGVSFNSYLFFNLYPHQDLIQSLGDFQILLGNDKDFLATRASYKLGLKGPSISVQTACSTSLVATVLACQSLLRYECDMALAGGVSIAVPQKSGYLYREGGITSPDGHCKAFDAGAQGTVFGSGLGVVVLKRLTDALENGDCIDAVILGSAINNDGSLKVGYTAPGVEGQSEVIMMAQAVAGVDAETITYVETHGTGTALGDPIEFEALVKAFRASSQKKNFCGLGSLKTNIGHLDVAAGVASLIKTVLALQHRMLPPSLHFEQPNPSIDLTNSPFYINARLSEWPAGATPRRAGVSSFGIGGTNAHVIIEEAPTLQAVPTEKPHQLIVLSAKTGAALDAATVNLVEYLKQNPEENLADVAYTYQVGRAAFNHRRIVVCEDVTETVTSLAAPDSHKVFTNELQDQSPPPVGFMFPGQGSQFVNMARQLYGVEPVFRRLVDDCFKLFNAPLGVELARLIYPPGDESEETRAALNQTLYAQPAIFVIEYALARLWMHWGVRPQAMIGHSIGEYVAACLAEVFSLEEAATLVSARARLMQALPPGAMLAIALPESEVQPLLLRSHLSLAAVNGASLCVVSGPSEAVKELEKSLGEKGVHARRLQTSHAFHSEMTSPMLKEFEAELRKVTFQPPRIPYVSNLTGTWIKPSESTDPQYWVQHLRHTVRFAAGLQELFNDPNRILLEVGPQQTLTGLARRHPAKRAQHLILASTATASGQGSDEEVLLNSLGHLWLAGTSIDWESFHQNEGRRRVHAPTYPFERRSFWINATENSATVSPRPAKLFKEDDLNEWFYVPIWKQSLPSGQSRVAARQNTKSSFLLFVDECRLGARLATRLRLEKQEVITVHAGSGFAALGEDAYSIDPSEEVDYQQLLDTLAARSQKPATIIHLWNITPSSNPARAEQAFEQSLERGFYSLVLLTRALARSGCAEPLVLYMISNELHDLTGEESLQPEKAMALGACKVIPQEYPDILCRSIEIALTEAEGNSQDQLVEQLLAEITSWNTDAVVAYRGKQRWIQTFERWTCHGPDKERLRSNEQNVYLIIGGLGSIGFVLSQELAREGAKLIITGRTALPEREARESWLRTHDDENEVSRRIRKVQSLEAMGAEVLVLDADVADESQMREALRLGRQKFGTLNGVIYSAGVGGSTAAVLLHELDREECARQLQAKVFGLKVLEKVLDDQVLDFCILQSSLSSVLGGLGLGAYSAAHLFLDAFAQKHNQSSAVPWRVINWDNWITENMNVVPEPTQGFEFVIVPKEGARVFHQLLSEGGATQVIVSTGDLQVRVEQWINPESVPGRAHVGESESQTLHPRPKLQNDYVAPRNALEQKVADLWRQFLGIDQIGIHDNYFELGGDSILSIQIIARAKQAGLHFSPRELFQHQTVAELAAIIQQTDKNSAWQGPVTGSVPLTPIQHWFFERRLSHAEHFNQAVLLQLPAPLEVGALREAVAAVVAHHDGLRLRYEEEEGEWRQSYGEIKDEEWVRQVDLSGMTESAQNKAVADSIEEQQQSLDLRAGPLVRVVQYELGEERGTRLLLVIHHLVVDVVSWRVVLEDLEQAYQARSRGETVRLAAKTSSYQSWAERLVEYAQSDELRLELPYWSRTITSTSALPVDHPGGDNNFGSVTRVTVDLSAAETGELLKDVPAAFRTQINDVLLTALVEACCAWSGGDSLLVDLEGHGRQPLFEDLDVTRTVGWFTNIYPVRLSVSGQGVERTLGQVKEVLRAVPSGGLGYGVLRYLSKDQEVIEQLKSLPQADISFLYLGQFDQTLSALSSFAPAQESSGLSQSSSNIRTHLLEVNARVIGGQLKVDWDFSSNLHDRSTVEPLAENFINTLRAIIKQSRQSETPAYSPSDFPMANISQHQLDKILNRFSGSKASPPN